tara:strand:+ start:497 stop:895 length:399 start_codon:yes stop_codon:yes gene_type:complete
VRRRLEKVLNSTYKPLYGVEPFVCFYCGERAGTVDHVPPISVAPPITEMDRVKVPCCSNCNCRLGNSLQPSLKARAEHLLSKVEEEWGVPPASKSELRGYGPNLRAYISADIDAKKTNLRRLQRLKERILCI